MELGVAEEVGVAAVPIVQYIGAGAGIETVHVGLLAGPIEEGVGFHVSQHSGYPFNISNKSGTLIEPSRRRASE